MISVEGDWGKSRRIVRALGLVLPGVCFWAAAAQAYVPAPDPHYCKDGASCSYYVAVNFTSWDLLLPRQIELLREFVPAIAQANDPRAAYQAWTDVNDGFAATFLGITLAFSKMTIFLDHNETRTGLDLVLKINRMDGDRMYFSFDSTLFERWKLGGSRFEWARADGKIETGQFHFGGWNPGGSLHKGYDEQGYTSVTRVPRMQINYRFADGEADVDLDGYAPWIWGWIPDPLHLTYQNSDVRHWYSKFVKKFGDPGFAVQKIKFGN